MQIAFQRGMVLLFLAIPGATTVMRIKPCSLWYVRSQGVLVRVASADGHVHWDGNAVSELMGGMASHLHRNKGLQRFMLRGGPCPFTHFPIWLNALVEKIDSVESLSLVDIMAFRACAPVVMGIGPARNGLSYVQDTTYGKHVHAQLFNGIGKWMANEMNMR